MESITDKLDENKPGGPERIPGGFSYHELGRYVLDQEFISETYFKQVCQNLHITFEVAFLETDVDTEISSSRHLINQELVRKNICTLIGLQVFSSCPKHVRKQLQEGTNFELVSEIRSLIIEFFQKFTATQTAIDSWIGVSESTDSSTSSGKASALSPTPSLLESVKTFKALSRRVRASFISETHPLTADFSRALAEYLSDRPIEKFADMFRAASKADFSRALAEHLSDGPIDKFADICRAAIKNVLNLDPINSSELLQLEPQTHAPLVEEINTFNTDSTADHIVRELKSIKLLKSIRPSLNQLGELLESITATFKIMELRQSLGVFYFHELNSPAAKDVSMFMRAQMLIHFILFADTKPWVAKHELTHRHIIITPFKLAGHDFDEDRQIKLSNGSIFITQSHSYDQVSRLRDLLSQVDEWQENQRQKSQKKSIRYSNHLYKFAYKVDFEIEEQLDDDTLVVSFDETCPSRLTSNLNTFIGFRLARHGLELDPISRHYFNDLARSYILNLYEVFYGSKTVQDPFPFFLTTEDKFFQELDSQNIELELLSRLRVDPAQLPLFGQAMISELKSKLILNHQADFFLLSPSDQYLGLITCNTVESALRYFSNRGRHFAVSDDFIYVNMLTDLDQSLNITQALDRLCRDFVLEQQTDRMIRHVYKLSQLTESQLKYIFQQAPVQILDTIARYLRQLFFSQKTAKVEVFKMFYQMALEQSTITEERYNLYNKGLKEFLGTEQVVVVPPAVEFNEQNLGQFAEQVKSHILYASILQIADPGSSEVTAKQVGQLANIIVQQTDTSLCDQIFDHLLQHNSLQIVFTHLHDAYAIRPEERRQVAEHFIRRIFEKFEVLKIEYGLARLVRKLPLDLIKSMYGLGSNLPSDLSEIVSDSLEQMRTLNPDTTQRDLDHILQLLTKDITRQSGMQVLKTIL